MLEVSGDEGWEEWTEVDGLRASSGPATGTSSSSAATARSAFGPAVRRRTARSASTAPCRRRAPAPDAPLPDRRRPRRQRRRAVADRAQVGDPVRRPGREPPGRARRRRRRDDRERPRCAARSCCGPAAGRSRPRTSSSSPARRPRRWPGSGACRGGRRRRRRLRAGARRAGGRRRRDGASRFEQLVPAEDTLQAITDRLDEARVIGTRVIVEPPVYRGVTVVAQLEARPRRPRPAPGRGARGAVRVLRPVHRRAGGDRLAVRPAGPRRRGLRRAPGPARHGARRGRPALRRRPDDRPARRADRADRGRAARARVRYEHQVLVEGA